MTKSAIGIGPRGRAVATNMKRLRTVRGMSLKALSDALNAAGRSLSQDAINKIENGAEEGTVRQVRRIDVDDLAALASVLHVTVDHLLTPPDQLNIGVVVSAAGADDA